VPVIPIAASVLVGLTAIAMLGIKGSLRVNGVLSLVAIAGLLFVIIFGVHRIGVADYTSSPHGLSGIFGATALVFFAFIGFDNVANLSEETKQPERTIPRGLLIALAITTLLYVLIGLVAVSVVPWQELSSSKAPLALVASKSLGHVAFDIVAITAMLTTLNTVLVQLLVSSRIIYGMGQAQALPGGFGRVSRRTSAPVLASGAAMLAALAFLSLGSVDVVAKVTSFGSLLTFAAVNLALLHLRRVAPHASRPFRVPLTIGWVSVPALLGLLSCLAMLTRFDWFSATLGLSLSLSGWLFYTVYSRHHSTEASSFHETHETGPPGKAAGT
ncbi:MAG: amino acid permease, partial [Chloroflexi bacterium]|nr:amino acid permease [Chloroflexota bacterium]